MKGFSLYAVLASSSLSLLIASVGFYSYLTIENIPTASQVSLVACTQEEPVPFTVAKAVYVEDLTSNTVLEEKNAYTQLPLASLTKIMTTAIVLESLSLDDTVYIPKEAFSVGQTSGLFAGEAWRAGDLLAFTLITSSNEGAHALAIASSETVVEQPHSFIERMNAKADEIGLTNTYFVNDTGLDVSTTTAGAYGSAHDIAKLFTFVANTYPEAAAASTVGSHSFTSLSGFIHDAEHTTSLARDMAGKIMIKTGYTDLAGGNLGVIVEPIPGRPVVIVVLGSTHEARESDIITLANYAKRRIVKESICNQQVR